MVPDLAKSHEEQAQSNGAIAQLGNLGASIGPPLFAMVLSQYKALGFLGLVLILCICGILLALYANKFRI